MKISIATTLAGIFLAQSASAWTFTYRDVTGSAHVIDGGRRNKGCTKISHGKGQVFEWNRGFFSDCCISLYSNNACEGNPQGYSCSDWKKPSSEAINSFKVTKC